LRGFDEVSASRGRRWGIARSVDGADAFDGATVDGHLARHFASVERREVGGDASWETRAELHTYLDALPVPGRTPHLRIRGGKECG
jgi:hypothetical protein